MDCGFEGLESRKILRQLAPRLQSQGISSHDARSARRPDPSRVLGDRQCRPAD
jgi:hypothetical protein